MLTSEVNNYFMTTKELNINSIKHLEAIINNIPYALCDTLVNKSLEAISEVTHNLPKSFRIALTENLSITQEVNANNRPDSK